METVLYIITAFAAGGIVAYMAIIRVGINGWLRKDEVAIAFVNRSTYDLLQQQHTEQKETIRQLELEVRELTQKITGLEKDEGALQEKLAFFDTEIGRLQQLSHEQFKTLASELLEEKRKMFVESNKSELGNIITPLKNDLDVFRKAVEETRKEDIREFASLKKELDLLQQLNSRLSDDARSLASALRSDTRVQGLWGEDRLQLILESEGLQQHIDYTTQQTLRDEEDEVRRRPDLILKLPNDRHLIIDSKVSITAYVNYCNAVTPEEKAKYLKHHVKSITDHIDYLAEKRYHALSGMNAPDYVFMFMPMEPAITLAMNECPDIFERALRKKIVLIAPTTLVATLKVVKIIWQKENQVRNVELIFKQCGALYDKFVTFLEELEKVGSGLQVAGRSYQEAMNRLTAGTRKGDTIIGRLEAIRKLEAKTNKAIPRKYIEETDLLAEPDEGELVINNS